MIDKEILKSSEYKKIRYITDVDVSVDRFENNFLNTYANLLPKETAVDKAFLIKNVLPLYLAKGTERSFKYLFRLLFDENVEVKYLRDNILRASDGKWIKENCLNVDATTIKSVYVGDNKTKTFNILGNYFQENIQVYVNGVLVTTGFDLHTSYKKIIFNSPPATNSRVEIFYTTVNKEIFTNRKITGLISGATALVEKTSFQLINGRLALKLFVDKKTIDGKFSIGEKIKTDLFVNNVLVDVVFESISEINYIKILDGGANYNIGDPVTVVSSGSKEDAYAVVEKVFFPTIEELNVEDGGAGFQVGQNVLINGISEPTVNIKVVAVNNQRTISVFTVYSDVISDIDYANTTLSSINFGLSIPNINLSSNINSSFSDISYTNIGEIAIIEINKVEIPIENDPTIDVLPSTVVIPNVGYTSTNTTVSIDTYGTLGKIVVHNGGANYNVGDEIVFTKKSGCLGIGAEAEVFRINSAGSIVEVMFVPSKISGTANVSIISSNVQVVGTGTKFLNELKSGDRIMIDRQERIVDQIFSNTSLTVTNGFKRSFTNKPVRFYGRYLVGGQGYSQNKLPTINVTSTFGTNANLEVTTILGMGDKIIGETTPYNGKKLKQIEKIKVLNPGAGFISIPEINLTQYGSGNAKAEGVLFPTFQAYEGRWLTTDSIISSSDRRLQGLNYYIDYSYLLVSPIQLVKYDSVVKNLLHPAGYIGYSQVIKQNTFTSANVSVESFTQIFPADFIYNTFPIGVGNTSILSSDTIKEFESNVSFNPLQINNFGLSIKNNKVLSSKIAKQFGIKGGISDATFVGTLSKNLPISVANSHVLYSENTNSFGVQTNEYILNVVTLPIQIDSTYGAVSENAYQFGVEVVSYDLNVFTLPIEISNTYALLSGNTNEFGLNTANSYIFYSKNTSNFDANLDVLVIAWELMANNVANVPISTNTTSYIAYAQNTANISIVLT